MTDRAPRATRLATPRWLDARLVAGVLLVLVSVVVGARVFAAAGRSTPVYLAHRALVPGERVQASDLSIARVHFVGPGDAYVAATRPPPVGYVMTRYVGPGELLPAGALTAAATTVAAGRLVTVPVAPGHLPGDLARGDLVDVYLSVKAATGAPGAPVRVLAGVPVDTVNSGGGTLSASTTVSVVLAVPDNQVAATIQAVESGSIDVVRVPVGPR